MMQFYFLSIVSNLVAGFALLLDLKEGEEEKFAFIGQLRELLQNESTRLVIAIISILAGVFKILSVVRLDIPIIGDLFPALTGISAGLALLYDRYAHSTSLNIEAKPFLKSLFITHKKWLAYACFASSLLHFLFPQVLFL